MWDLAPNIKEIDVHGRKKQYKERSAGSQTTTGTTFKTTGPNSILSTIAPKSSAYLSGHTN